MQHATPSGGPGEGLANAEAGDWQSSSPRPPAPVGAMSIENLEIKQMRQKAAESQLRANEEKIYDLEGK